MWTLLFAIIFGTLLWMSKLRRCGSGFSLPTTFHLHPSFLFSLLEATPLKNNFMSGKTLSAYLAGSRAKLRAAECDFCGFIATGTFRKTFYITGHEHSLRILPIIPYVFATGKLLNCLCKDLLYSHNPVTFWALFVFQEQPEGSVEGLWVPRILLHSASLSSVRFSWLL